MLIIQTIELLIYATLIGVASSVYANILLYTDALQWWVKIGQRYQDKIWAKPIWFCDKCISGQIALWVFLLNTLNKASGYVLTDYISFIVPILGNSQINLLNGFILISITILIATITTKQINRL